MSVHEENSVQANMDSLLEWCTDCSGLKKEISNRYFVDYIAWKIPFPMEFIENAHENLAIRLFCAERLISKLISVSSVLENSDSFEEFQRVYCLVTEPNMFGSEVGVVFSKEKWEGMLARSIDTETYFEKISQSERTLSQKF